MFEIVLAFLGLSILLYALLAGADFGAGILELFSLRGPRRKAEAERSLVTHAIGPVWEANHIWLIIAVVILFMGFPKAYARISTELHLPLTAMLFGVVGRGCAFTFRHYDAVKDGSQRFYNIIFVLSSLWTSLFLGILVGALLSGGLAPGAASYPERYVFSWLRPFPVTVGLFVSACFAFLAAVYLTLEAADPGLRKDLLRKARRAGLVLILTGGLVFLAAARDGFPLHRAFLAHPSALACFSAATVLLPFLFRFLSRGQALRARTTAMVLVALVLGGWFAVQYPYVYLETPAGGWDGAFREGGVLAGEAGFRAGLPAGKESLPGLTFREASAPAATLKVLALGLLLGSVLILPALFYLLLVFKDFGRGLLPPALAEGLYRRKEKPKLKGMKVRRS